MTKLLNIAGYKFIKLSALEALRTVLRRECTASGIKGTVLLSEEGINATLAGEKDAITAFKTLLRQNARFSDMRFHESYSDVLPFQCLKIKIKKEIISFRQNLNVTSERAPAVSPEMLQAWLDEKRDMTLLDTRNDYEIDFGTFAGAVNLKMQHFGELPKAIETLDRKKPIVMFCTGGIRCEKAALYMQEHGFEDVYQLDGGILGYFARVGQTHYEGDCFVFDERVAVGVDALTAKA